MLYLACVAPKQFTFNFDLGFNSELRKHRNMGNKFPEPKYVFRNQVIRQGRNIQESVKLVSNNFKKDRI